MIVISFLPQQGLGNQLWLLFSAISIAKYLNFSLRILNSQNFKGWALISDNLYSQLISIDYQELPKNHIFLNPSLFVHKSGNLYYPHDLHSFTYLKCFEAIVIEDICQSIHILEEKEVISSYFRASTCDVSISPSTCIINIRGGDYLGFRKSPAVPRQYYLSSIQKMKFIEPSISFLIVTDDYRYAKSLLPDYPILEGDYFDDFNNLKGAHYLILSNSSFAFFPAYINPNLKYAVAPSYWAPSTKAERQSNSWYSPSNFYPTMFHYINPYTGTDLKSSFSEYEACFSTLGISLPLSGSIVCKSNPSKFFPDNHLPSHRNIFKSAIKALKKNLLYLYLDIFS